MHTLHSVLPEARRLQAHALAAALPNALWHANAFGRYAAAGVPTGYSQLNKELPGGGWPPSVLTELLWAQHGSGEFRLLAPVLEDLSQTGKSIIMLAPPHLVFAPALAQLGIDIDRVLVVQPGKSADRLWAVEQILKSANFGALLCWLPQARPDHLRRLQLAAGGSEGLAFVFRPAAAQAESSPAPLRLLCQAEQFGKISLEIIKRRGPAASAPVLLTPPLPSILKKAVEMPRAVAKTASPIVVPLPAIASAESSDVMDSPVPAATAA